jgi:hypothetical protein
VRERGSVPGVAEDADQITSHDVSYNPQRVAQNALRQDPSLDEDLVLRLAIEARSHLAQMTDVGSFDRDPDAPALARRLLTHVTGAGASAATVVARAAADEWEAVSD